MEPTSFEEGATVFAEGDAAGPAYLIKSGKAEISIDAKEGPRVIAMIAEGSIFGEMSLIDGSPRSATVRAVEPLECFEITEERFDTILGEKSSIARSLFEIQTHRLRKAAEQMKSLDTIHP
jgi:CRP-like cAMP-binding protein